MTKVIIKEITHCKDCPHKNGTPYPTEDSWERAEYWWCTHPDNDIVIEDCDKNQELKIKLINTGAPSTMRFISGYVEWTDEKHITCMDWCKLENK